MKRLIRIELIRPKRVKEKLIGVIIGKNYIKVQNKLKKEGYIGEPYSL
jgi:hypothetical protein